MKRFIVSIALAMFMIGAAGAISGPATPTYAAQHKPCNSGGGNGDEACDPGNSGNHNCGKDEDSVC